MMIKRAARGKFQIFLTFNNLAPTEIVPPPIIYEYYHHAMLSPHIIIIIFSSRKITEANSDKHLSSVKLKCSNGLKLLFTKKRAATSHASIEIYFKNFFAHLKLCFYCTWARILCVLLTFTHNLAMWSVCVYKFSWCLNNLKYFN